MRYHFISIGGAVMHNLALDLQANGHQVTGSDDEIFEPALSRLKQAGLLPEKMGWFRENIHDGIDGIILGMHAKQGNPELEAALLLQIPVYSFPEFIYKYSLQKRRIVIGGSHGKTTSTAMLMHIYKSLGLDFDYMAGSAIDGFDRMVKLSESATDIILEGDEYLTSALNPVPKFHIYKPHIAMITGIAWDHINVFPDFDIYIKQFDIFIQNLPKGAPLIWFQGDEVLHQLVKKYTHIKSIPYTTHPHYIKNGHTFLSYNNQEIPVHLFGIHNLQNLAGVKALALQAGITEQEFYTHISTFTGTSRRLEKIYDHNGKRIFRDFAHSPSKVKATVDAASGWFSDDPVIACFELHTFSSLNKNFLSEYEGSMDSATIKAVYYNPHTFEMKNMPVIYPADIKHNFGSDTQVLDTPDSLKKFLSELPTRYTLLMMSSGAFSPVNILDEIDK